MKKAGERILKLAASLLVLFFAFISCITRPYNCGGDLIIENEIPDTVLYVGGEPFYRDLVAEPVVLKQTEGKEIRITGVLAKDGTIVSGTRARSATSGNLNAVEIKPLKEGETEIIIRAEDPCTDIEFGLNVTVIDTTQ